MEKIFDSITKSVTINTLTNLIPFITRHETYGEHGDIFVIEFTKDFTDTEIEKISELTNVDYDDLQKVKELRLFCLDMMTQVEYENRNLQYCPFCGSDDIDEGETRRNYLSFIVENVCHNCNVEWEDIYCFDKFDITKK